MKGIQMLAVLGATFMLLPLAARADFQGPSGQAMTLTSLAGRIDNNETEGWLTPVQARQFHSELQRIDDEASQYNSSGNALPRAILLSVNADMSSLNAEIDDAIASNQQAMSSAFIRTFNSGVNALETKLTERRTRGQIDNSASTEIETALHDLAASASTNDVMTSRQANTIMTRLNHLSAQLDQSTHSTVLGISTAVKPNSTAVRRHRKPTSIAARRSPNWQ